MNKLAMTMREVINQPEKENIVEQWLDAHIQFPKTSPIVFTLRYMFNFV